MSRRTNALWFAVAVTAAVLPPSAARAGTGPDNVLSGRVLLPDGSPAIAAVVDLSVAGYGAFARGVTGMQGEYELSIPDLDELRLYATLDGDRLRFTATITDLRRKVGNPVVPLPGENLDAYQIVQDGRALLDRAHLVGDPPAPAWDIDDLTHGTFAEIELVESTVRDAARALPNSDPDMLLGNDNPDDPDLVPPLGADMITLAGALLPDTAVTDQPVEGGGSGNACTRVPQTYWWTTGGQGTQPPDGLDWYVYLVPYRCKDNDPEVDHVLYAWEGKGTPHGPEHEHDPDYWSMFRLKYRVEAYPQSDYMWQSPDPATDTTWPDGGSISWGVGYSMGGFSGGISGNFPMASKTKNHPWQDNKGKLLHSSWLSKNKAGMTGTHWNEMGWMWVMPQSSGVHYHDIKVQVWRCHHVKHGPNNWKDTCDKR